MFRFARRLLVLLTALVAVLLSPLPAATGQPLEVAGDTGAWGAPRAASGAAQLAPAVGTNAAALEVGAITLSRSSVAASGVATVPVTVTAQAKTTDSEPMSRLVIAFERDRPPPAGVLPALFVTMERVSGTPTDGVWRGVAHVGSVYDGTLTATAALRDPCWTCGTDVLSADLAGPSIRVRGSHIPRIQVAAVPNPIALSARAATVRATVIDSDTGRAFAKPVTVWFAFDNVCVEGEATTSRATVGGVARLALDVRRDKNALLGLHCAFLYGPKDTAGQKVPLVANATYFDVTSTVTIRPAASSVRVNRPLRVSGTIADARSLDVLTVSVQRLTGRSQWRTLATATATNGRYSTNIRYGTRGRLTLRTVVQGVKATSRTTVVTVR